MPTTDPFSAPPSAGLWFWTQQWDWFVKVVTLLHAQLLDVQGKVTAQASALAATNTKLEGFIQMTQDADLAAAVAANTQAVADLSAALDPLADAVNAAVADVQQLINLLNAGPTPSPAVAQAISDVSASTSALQTASARLSADASSLQTVEAGVPVPPPAAA